MKKVKIAINGFGRIGRIFFRQAFSNPDIEIVAINDLGSPENLVYLLKYDSVYGPYEKKVTTRERNIVVDDHEIIVLQEKDPSLLPWKELEIDIVIESTGFFESRDKASLHLNAGAKRVVISAPTKDDTPIATPNVGMDTLSSDKISSNASCTTNATNPVVAIMMANPGIEKALLTTIHGYTATQGLVDGPDKKDDFRRGRAAAQNIVPSTTGAAKATTRVIKELEGKFDGLAIRVPVISGSLIDFTFIASRPTSVEEINNILKEAAAKPEWQGIMMATEDPIVSSDILGNSHGSIVDLALTRVADGNLIKVFSWYDNEWGYCSMLLKHVLTAAQIL